MSDASPPVAPARTPTGGGALASALAVSLALLAMSIAAGVPTGDVRLRALAVTVLGVGGAAAFVHRVMRVSARTRLPSTRDAALAAATGVALSAFGAGALLLERALLPGLADRFAAREVMMDALLRRDSPLDTLLVVVVVVAAPALVEELLFRGLLRSVMASASVAQRVAVLGGLFGLFHVDVVVLLPLAYVGAILTLTAERSAGWTTAAIAHAALNATSVFALERVNADGVWVPAAMVIAGAWAAVAAVGGLRGADVVPAPQN
ncbi:MAG: CPBP family intramembrane metalloprotease [Myxococcales bacterium]|nr:CPBP family intramembrane metalloprotease [Myxococcales bacterium]MCB9531067.1 CPBP family intramembrane metalloprotease [Myxococcales bacterium]MCB9532977.1 CPBP family intramembrane metalloprotease [Myxococcales bacterium]